MILLTLFLATSVIAQLRDDIIDCGEYEKKGTVRQCYGQQSGCVTEGWFSKVTKDGDIQRVNANQACLDAGYKLGADKNNFGGNWGHQCRFPGSGTSTNKAGGSLLALGYTVTFKCMGEKEGGGGGNKPPPLSECLTLDKRITNCEGFEGRCEGAGCRRSKGWYSSVTRDKKNAINICKSQGYKGEITLYGGNWGQECRHPGTNLSMVNKAGGTLASFGYTVTFKCDGPQVCKGGVTKVPTSSPTQDRGCYALDERVQNCEGWKGSCSGAGCVDEKGWFSKTTRDRLDATEICKSQGYSGEVHSDRGGNWGQQCRYPGGSIGSPNRAGGSLTSYGYTVTWKCLGEQKCDGGTLPTKKPVVGPTPKPTVDDAKKCPMYMNRMDVKDCGKYDGSMCKGQGVGCAGKGWFSKITKEASLSRVNAVEVCKSQGYSGDIFQYGGNWGAECRHPGTELGSTNKAGGSITNFGFTVTWQCHGKSQCDEDPDKETPEPTLQPTSETNLPDHVTDCGKGWFSKIRDPKVNAIEICRDMGYKGGVGDYGGNFGVLCRYPGNGNLRDGGSPNKAGGSLENFGATVTWQCLDLPDDIPDHIHACGNNWYSMVRGAEVNPEKICKDLGYTGEVKDYGIHDDKLCNESENGEGGDSTGLEGSVSWLCSNTYDRPDHIVHCDDYEGTECENQGEGCVKKGDGWFSKTTNPSVNAKEICEAEGYDEVDETSYGGNWGNQCRYPGYKNTKNELVTNKAGGSLESFGMTVTWRCTGGNPKPTPKPTKKEKGECDGPLSISDIPETYDADSYLTQAKNICTEDDCKMFGGKWKGNAKSSECKLKDGKKGIKVKCKHLSPKKSEMENALCDAIGCKNKKNKCDGKPTNLQR